MSFVSRLFKRKSQPDVSASTNIPSSISTTNRDDRAPVKQEKAEKTEKARKLEPVDPNDKVAVVRQITGWEEVTAENFSKDERCCICLCEFIDEDDEEPNEDIIVKLSQCGTHYFHQNCIIQCYVPPKPTDTVKHNGHVNCPICSFNYGVRTGIMPKGTMNVRVTNQGLPSYSGSKTIEIRYNFPSGIQGPEHPSPGASYSGTSRHCYLPDTPEGREVLRKLQIAFDRRLSFTIGTSITTGMSNCVIWNGIHHKTSRTGGPTRFGYPDATYLNRVSLELASVGVL